ncbi:hypothetical protein GEV37_03295 [Halomonas malpeensis]|uniref:Uncharacterized protein n=1 Tax=Vreelandella malpeensis TaxID=1172368 RepID=A0ABS8DPC7_9GAMM|nr:hypothetical protein [Halomonas malpeensis]
MTSNENDGQARGPNGSARLDSMMTGAVAYMLMINQTFHLNKSLMNSRRDVRGMSAAFLRSGGQNFRAELPDQRRRADQELGEFNAYITGILQRAASC